MITIIEDCSPYYIRFAHDGMQDIIDLAAEAAGQPGKSDRFQHKALPIESGRQLVNLVPKSKELRFNPARVSLFITPPGYAYGAHKDGRDMQFGLNYHVSIKDDKCVTSWYADEELADYKLWPSQHSRELIGADLKKHTPLKSVVFRPGEVSLLNVDMFHAFDNSMSANERVVLTFRDMPVRQTFEDARRILFG